MSEIAIKDFRKDVQQYINKYGIDYNKSGFIETDNGELSNLLNGSGVKDVDKLYSTGKLRAPSTNAAIAGFAVGGLHIASLLKTNFLKNTNTLTKILNYVGIGGALAISSFFAVKAITTKESNETLAFQK